MAYRLLELEQKYQKEAIRERYYALERDRLKNRVFLYASYPVLNDVRLHLGNLKRFIYIDVLARHQRFIGQNVLFSLGYQDLEESVFESAKQASLLLPDYMEKTRAEYREQLQKLDIGFDFEKEITCSHPEYLAFVQDIVKLLYDAKLVTYREKQIYEDPDTGIILQDYEIEYFNEKYYYQDREVITYRKKVCVLDYSRFQESLITELSMLKLAPKYKEALFHTLGYYLGCRVIFPTTAQLDLEVDMMEPVYLSGVSFIAIHKNYANVLAYCEEAEKESIVEFITSEMQNKTLFSGNYAINPFDQREIPIFISDVFPEEIHLGIPNLNEEDEALAAIFGLEFLPIFDYKEHEKVLCNSRFLDGLTVLEANEMMLNYLVDNRYGMLIRGLRHTEFTLWTKAKHGCPFPGYEQHGVLQFFPSNQLPIHYDSRLKLYRTKTEIVDEKVLEGSIHPLFQQALLPLAIRLRNLTGISSIRSLEGIEEYTLFPTIKIAVLKKETYFSELFMNMVLQQTLQNLLALKRTPSFETVLIEEKVLGTDGRKMLRELRNVQTIEGILHDYGASGLRMFFALEGNVEEHHSFQIQKMPSIDKVIAGIIGMFDFPIQNVVLELESKFIELLADVNAAIRRYDISTFAKRMKWFSECVMETKKISIRQAKGFLILLSCLCPSLAEYLNREKLHANYSILLETWPG